MLVTCGNCGKWLEKDHAETCWWCHWPLCFACWLAVGHCGHPEAEAENERARRWHRKHEGR